MNGPIRSAATVDEEAARAEAAGLEYHGKADHCLFADLVARRRIGDALDDVAALQADPVARVRTAAHRALIALVEHDA